jgi:hypothetical protein
MSGTFTLALEAILASVHGKLSVTPTGWPSNARRYIVPGQLAWDSCECGLLAIEWQNVSYTGAFPNPRQALADGCRPYLALQLLVTVLRCAPNPGPHGEPPSPEDINAAAIINLDDMEAVLSGTSQAVSALENSNIILQYALAGVNPAGPNGGCVGVTQQIFLGFANRWGPC